MEIVYRSFKTNLASKKIDWNTTGLKVALVRSDYAPNVLHSMWSEVAPYEIAGSAGSYEQITSSSGKVLANPLIVEMSDGTVYCTVENPVWDSATISSAAMAVVVWWDSTAGGSGAYRLVSCHSWRSVINGATTQGSGILFCDYGDTGTPSRGALFAL